MTQLLRIRSSGSPHRQLPAPASGDAQGDSPARAPGATAPACLHLSEPYHRQAATAREVSRTIATVMSRRLALLSNPRQVARPVRPDHPYPQPASR